MTYQLVAEGIQEGPVSDEALQSMIAQGAVSADTLCKQDGWADWRAVAQVFPDRFTQVRQATLPAEPSSAAATPPPQEPMIVRKTVYQETTAGHPATYKPTGFTWVLLGLVISLVILAVSAVVISNC
ncbi:MAG TPA: DUF4339 domain-containing protein [Rariglobus sp.]